jgi:hypothetical protein
MKIFLLVLCLLASTFANIQPPLLPRSFIAKLYARDAIASTYNFHLGNYANQFNPLTNRIESQFVDIMYSNELLYSPQANCIIMDLGSQEQLASRYHYQETVGNGQGFSSIQYYHNQKFLSIKNKSGYDVQYLNESSKLNNTSYTCHAHINVNHVYIYRAATSSGERVVKFLVLSYTNSTQLTLRFSILKNTLTDRSVYSEYSHIRTLYMNDSITHSLSFSTGSPAHYFCDFGDKSYITVCQNNSDIEFNFNWIYLSTERRNARVLLIGNELSSNDNELFSSLTLNSSTYSYIDYYGRYIYGNARPLFNGTYQTTLYPYAGNVYLIRYIDYYNPKFSRLVKFKIMQYQSGILTIRYKLISESEHQIPPRNSALVNSRMAVIYGKDFITHSINMITGKPGSTYCNTNETSVCNAGSDFEYNNYYSEAFSAGIEGSVVGGIINITNDIKYSDDYASLYYDPTSNSIKKYNSVIIGSNELMSGNSKYYALVKLGNAYVIRDYSYTNGESVNKISKLVVVDYKPNEYVVIRWDLLYPNVLDTSSSYNSDSSYRHPHFHPVNPIATHTEFFVGQLIVTVIVWIFAILSIIVLIADCVIKNRRTYVRVSPNDVISNTIHSENL